jgi:hypothetical protein
MTKIELAEMLRDHFQLQVDVFYDNGANKVRVKLTMNDDNVFGDDIVVLESYDLLPS